MPTDRVQLDFGFKLADVAVTNRAEKTGLYDADACNMCAACIAYLIHDLCKDLRRKAG